MKKNKLNISISLMLYGTCLSVFAGAPTTYSSGSKLAASYLTYDEKYKTSSSFIVTNPGTSLSAAYRTGLPTSGSISVGNGAASGDTDAYMLIQNGARVSADQNIFIGSSSALASYVTVNGSGSSLSAPQIRVGNADGGDENTLNITDGGSVTGFDVYAAYRADGKINVQGAGSILTVKPGVDATNTPFKLLSVGTDGYTGTLNVSDNATANVVDGAMLSLGGSGLSTGGTGILTITNGGVVNAGIVAAGNSIDGSDASITVTGNGSQLKASTLYLGADNGSATATVGDGGEISLSGQIVLGAGTSGSSDITLNEGGVLSVGGPNGILYGGSSKPARFTMNGGTLQANQSRLTSNVNMSLGEGSASYFNSNNLGMLLSGELSGSGSLTKTGLGVLNLSGNNTYTGNTLVAEGTLQGGIENAISSSNSLHVATSAIFDLGGYDQKVNSLSGEGDVVLGDKQLTEDNKINTSSTLSGTISGLGNLVKTGEGQFILAGDNTYTGMTTISAGTLQIGKGGTTGSVTGDITDNAALVFNRNNDLTYGGIISGSGSVEQAGTGTTLLIGNNTYTGPTTVSSGTLKTGVANAIAYTSGVTVGAAGAAAILNLGGTDQTVTSLTNNGTILINDIGADVLANAVTLTGNVTNSGTVVINNGSTNAGQTLVVDGNWVGQGGTVSIGTVLGGDNSLTDKLAITGSASGTTNVSVTNEGGSGGQTREGIEVITTGSSIANAFVQSGRIVANSYEYYLQKGSSSGTNTNNWYLTSSAPTLTPESTPTPEPEPTPVYRPERGSYASNLQAAGTMFNTRLKDRQADSVYVDPVTGERHASSVWVRAVGGYSEGQISDSQSRYKANRMVFQMGGNILTGSFATDDTWSLGVMGGYGKQYSSTHNDLSGYRSKGQVWGYSAGLYGTWYQNAKDKTGLYVDSWLLYNWFDNSVKGDELAYEKYKSKGVTASIESGYAFHAGSYTTLGGMVNNVFVTPQAQVLWSGVQADNHTEQNGTRVQGRGSDNVQTRVGVRLSVTGQSLKDKGTVQKFEPFVEANWVYTAKKYGVKMGSDSAYIPGSRHAAEIKAGVEGHVSENLSVWTNVAQLMGEHSFRDTQGMLGLKYAF